MLNIKVFTIPKKLPKYNFPSNITKHCGKNKSSVYAWYCLNKYIDLSKVKFLSNGKPYINNKQFVSLSHSHNKVAIAISNKNVGIDIELVKDDKLIAKRMLNKTEYQEYLSSKQSNIYFTKWWTKNEAKIKFGKKHFNKCVFKQIRYKNKVYIVCTIC